MNVRIERIVKHLEMMGFDVLVNKRFDYIQICLRTKDNFLAYTLKFDRMEEDFIVEKVVKEFVRSLKGE